MDSSTTALIVAAILVVAVLMVIVMIARARRSKRLRTRFGPEYERTLETHGDARRAEADLHDRQRRVARLDIRPLAPFEREGFISSWRAIQAEFVDTPTTALADADTLLTQVMKARGYPVEDFDQRAADVSVDHPGVVQNYWAGRAIALREKRGEASTEDMRLAMIHYRTLFDELVHDAAAPSGALREA